MNTKNKVVNNFFVNIPVCEIYFFYIRPDCKEIPLYFVVAENVYFNLHVQL